MLMKDLENLNLFTYMTCDLTEIVHGNKNKWKFTYTVKTLIKMLQCYDVELKQERVTHVTRMFGQTSVRALLKLVWFGTQLDTLHTLLHNELKYYRCVMLTRMCSSKHFWLVLLCAWGRMKLFLRMITICVMRTRDNERKWIHLSNLLLSLLMKFNFVLALICRGTRLQTLQQKLWT